ncbi:hypothetical protein QBC34DRAFT_418465 [Podospora aff. communis PSN243]|uniref:C3H1-type domain-containing protein n=1 Tax=Podospora aff. communis PSN243 TaxID=3040156 RepID=A0AAV9G2D0_9PEZI|nr:hypothetical protein QBC34DRAFT_418465 [Podospora aff. communis PSN243]
MTVCKFWQNGFCRNGSSCRFEHPPKNQPQSSNRFGVLAGSPSMSSGRSEDWPYGLNAEQIQRELVNELPPWILSCYAPGKEAPEQLFGGPDREQSFEEVRLHYLKGEASGNPNGALQDIQKMYQAANQQIQHTVANLNQAMQFIVDAGNKHPNRVDICRASVPDGGTSGVFSKGTGPFGSTNPYMNTAATTNPFGAPASGGGAFGQPSALGQKPNPFGTPAFGQPSQPAATSPFGQPAAASAFGKPATTSAFGQPATTSAFGQPATTSAFGQPSILGSTTAFGQPPQPSSAFGQTSTLGAKPNPFGAPAFGQPAQPSGGSAFGQPATLGQKSNPFGAPAGPSPFAASAAPPANNPFGQLAQSTASPFGQPATTTAPATSAFGQPTPAANSPFGAPAASSPGAFGAPAAPATSAPASSPFGAPAASASPFAAASAPAPTPTANPFGQPAPAPTAAALATNPFGAPPTTQPPAPSSFGGGFGVGAPAAPVAKPTGAVGQGPYAPDATRQHPDISTYSSKGPDGYLRMFKGRPVAYQPLGKDGSKVVPVIRNPDNSVARIWFPDGPPAYTPDTEAADPSAYNDATAQQQWKAFMETGMFAGGLMPEVPPKREFCAWNF